MHGALLATLNDPSGSPADFFGNSVATDGKTVVIGASQSGSGAAYIYAKGKSGWPASPAVTLLDPTAGGNSDFGNSVAISANTIVIGAQYTNVGSNNAQAPRTFM